jgi:hypothetical protein
MVFRCGTLCDHAVRSPDSKPSVKIPIDGTGATKPAAKPAASAP